MKYLLSLVFLAFVVIGCSSDGNKPLNGQKDNDPLSVDSTELVTTTAENATESFFLNYKFAKGSKSSYRVTQITNQLMDYSGAENKKIKINQSIINLINLEVLEVDPDGTMDIKCTVTKIKINAESGEEKINYETGVTQDTTRRFAKYEAIINNSFDIILTKYGEITELSKIDRIVTKFIALNKLKEDLKPEEVNYIKQGIIETTIKPILAQLFRQTPEVKIAKDSMWVKNQPETGVLTYKVTSTEDYKVENLEMYDNQKIAKINAVMNTSFEGSSKTTQNGISYDISKPVVESKGLIYFNVDKGFIQKSMTSTKLKMVNKMTKQGKVIVEKQDNENKNIVEFLN